MTTMAVYMRVSTDKQDTDMQRHAILKFLAEKQVYPDIEWYVDEGVSGTTKKRPAFQRMLQDINDGKIGAVTMYRLDRISRKAVDALELIMDWVRRDLELFVVDQPILNLGRENPFRLTIIAMFSELAQIERDTLVQRTKAGLEAARARGARIGVPKTISTATENKARELRQLGWPIKQIARKLKISSTSVWRLTQ